MSKREQYAVADKAWQFVVGCSPNMSCAPRCWARRTVARVVECQRDQNPYRAKFFQNALRSDLQRWSGRVFLAAMEEWPERLRVRELPRGIDATA
jgi:hypothetical protein